MDIDGLVHVDPLDFNYNCRIHMRLKQKTHNAQDHILSENNQVNGVTYEYVGKINKKYVHNSATR